MPSKRPRASGASDTAVVEKATKTNGALEREHVERPPIVPLDLAWVKGVKINSASVKRRAAEIPTRRTVKKDWQAAWLLRGAAQNCARQNCAHAAHSPHPFTLLSPPSAVTNIDLTTLAGDDTPGNVQRLCAKAKNPVRSDILAGLGCADLGVTCGAVCVYPSRVADAVACLKGTGIPVASVATGFPSGQIAHEHKLAEIRGCVADGAMEIDIVIPRDKALRADWEGLYREVCDFREACGPAHMKAILAVGELPTWTVVYQCSLVCMMAGSDFIKTSTGKEPTNATLPVSLVMCRAIREYHTRTGHKVGFKPAGGIRSAKDACAYLCLMREELGVEWQKNHLFRIGASALLTDIERQLHHNLTGEYAAGATHMAMG